MRTKKTLVFAAGLLMAAGFLRGQLLPSELGEEARWIEFLKTAAITATEQYTGSKAVTNPYKLTLEKDGVKHLGLWKNIDKVEMARPDRWRYEIAAYRMDRLLGLNMVPLTIERRHKEDRGSLQLWAESQFNLETKNDKKIGVPPRYTYGWNNATFLQRAFDNLIANEDRHSNNILITQDWRMILIDHSRSFRVSKKFTDKLIYTEKHPEGPKLMKQLPRAFVEKLKGLSAESIKGAVGEYLDDDEIKAILVRRDLILAEIDRLIKKNGEENTLY
jgi:hypothetical protein